MKAHIIERSAKYSLIMIWVFSITVALPMVLFRRLYERHWKDHVELWCDDDWSIGALQGTPEPTIAFHRPARMTYYTIICLILFIFPIVAMIGAYCGIIRTLWLNEIPGERLTHDVSGQMKMKRKVVIMLIFILTVFSVCWFPLQISILYSEYRSDPKMMGKWYDTFYFLARTLAFSNSAINPIIYAGFNENFRKGIKSMCGCYKKPRWTAIARIDSFRSTTLTATSKTVLAIQPRTCGAGAIVIFNNKEIELKQPSFKRGSILLAELVAIKLVLDYVSRIENKTLIEEVKIFSDSQTAIGILTLNWKIENHRSTSHEIISLIKSIQKHHGIRINFDWTPGHADVRGNEIADKLAKEAAKEANQIQKEAHITVTKQDIKTAARILVNKKWQHRWDNSDTGRFYYNFHQTDKG
ncbi:Hypothetical predicted protein [Mytilus galloprovincialis]|uniref:G-protein coupled receptors family 1 profile domain-containing protein n=1 Tax=Mytilus galloprovincialis TaxID=29158 RepID=A0A8B6DQN9_MYTGA|nr:Hypothetical predicted protein [Mytilus galloprovincialis]